MKKDPTLRLFSETLANITTVNELLVVYSFQDPTLVKLYGIFKDRFLEFLNLFSGITIRFPKRASTEELTYTLLPEIQSRFGIDSITESYSRFGGKDIKVPTFDDVSVLIRDLDIYLKVSEAKQDERKPIVQKLANHYHLGNKEVVKIFKRVRNTLRKLSTK